MTESNRTFCFTNSRPVSGELVSPGVSSSAARFENQPTCTSTTESSGCRLKMERNNRVASGASELRANACG